MVPGPCDQAHKPKSPSLQAQEPKLRRLLQPFACHLSREDDDPDIRMVDHCRPFSSQYDAKVCQPSGKTCKPSDVMLHAPCFMHAAYCIVRAVCHVSRAAACCMLYACCSLHAGCPLHAYCLLHAACMHVQAMLHACASNAASMRKQCSMHAHACRVLRAACY